MSDDIAVWIEKLNSDDRDVRRAAVIAIRRIGEPALQPMLDALIDGTVQADYLADGLHQLESAAIEPLIDILRDSPDEVQSRVAQVLGILEDDRSVTALIMALGDENVDVRANVAEALGSFSDPRAVAPLLNTLQNDEPEVQVKAVEALAPYAQEEGVVEALLESINSENDKVRLATIRSMAHIDEPRIREALKDRASTDEDIDVRQLAVAATRHLDGDPLAFKRLDSEKDVKDSIAKAIKRLEEMDRLDTQSLDVLRASNPRVRAVALEVLGEKGSKLAISAILPGLSDINPAVRATAVQALAKLGEPIIDPLLVELENNKSAYVRAGIITVFGRMKAERTFDVVLRRMNASEEVIREAVVNVLADWGNEDQVLPLLKTGLNDTVESVQEAAEKSLVKRGYDPKKLRNPISGFLSRFRKK